MTTEGADGDTSTLDLTHQPQLSRLCYKGLPAVVFNPCPSWVGSSTNLPVRDALTNPLHLKASLLDKLGFVQEKPEEDSFTPIDKQRDHKYLLSFKGRSIDQPFSTVNTALAVALARSDHLPEHLKNVVPVQTEAGRKRCWHPACYVGETEAPTSPSPGGCGVCQQPLRTDTAPSTAFSAEQANGLSPCSDEDLQ